MLNKILALSILLLVSLTVSAQSVIYLGPGATLKTTGGAHIILDNMNLKNDGTINQLPGEGLFKFTGAADNTISGTNQPLLDVVELVKTGTAKISLEKGIGIGTTINFLSGLLDLNSNNILMTPTALLIGESETSRIIGPTGGYVEITNTLNAPAGANPGNLGATFTSATNMGSTLIRRGHLSQTSGGGGNSIFRYYDIVPTNNVALDATLRFQYFDAELNSLNESVLVLFKSDDNIVWSNQGFTSRDVVNNSVEKTGIADFSRWTLSTPNNPLPVVFISFAAKCNNNNVALIWKTASEQNSSYFEIQRSNNGTNWTVLGRVQGAGNSSVEKDYSFTDHTPAVGNAIYRIAQYDIDGKVKYTNAVKNSCSPEDMWSIWPNPVQQLLFVKLTVATGSRALIKVYDSKGAFVKEQQNELLSGSNQVSIDMSRLPAGIYNVMMIWHNGQMKKSVKIIKQ